MAPPPYAMGLHSSTFQLNLSRFGTEDSLHTPWCPLTRPKRSLTNPSMHPLFHRKRLR